MTGKNSSSFRVRAVTGKVSRIRADTAKALIEEFDHLCNEGEASLTFIDDEAVATIRRHF